MKKVLVSLPEDLVDRLDREAAEHGKTRSRILQEAAQAYLLRRRTRPDATERMMRSVEEARALSRTLTWKPGTWEQYVRGGRDAR